jgi:serine/threonine-protein kinase RsbT
MDANASAISQITLKMVNGLNRHGISVIATDDGPGIPDIRQALRGGFSTSGSLGLGLPGVRRLMDEFEITSQPNPTWEQQWR